MIKIAENLPLEASKTVAELVTENLANADVFKKYGIDFCCGGGVSVAEACRKKKAPLDTVLHELWLTGLQKRTSSDYKNWDPLFLIDYIENVHHHYVKQSLPVLLSYAQKVNKVHGHHYQAMGDIQKNIVMLAQELEVHLQKEEKILFPRLRELFRHQTPAQIEMPIQVMMQEHEDAGEILRTLRNLSNNYQAPNWACNTFRALFAKLEEFENDLHVHIHLENNILFPAATDRLHNSTKA